MSDSNSVRTTKPRTPIPEGIERIAAIVIDLAFRVHSILGPGLLESVYERCLAYEIRKAGLRCERQVERPVIYDGHPIESGFKIDLLVEGCLIVELKALDSRGGQRSDKNPFEPIHYAQTMTYLRLSGLRLGLLINFNVVRLKGHVKRVIV